MKTFCALFLLSVATLAFGADSSDPLKGACSGDVDKFCKGVEPGGGKILRCLSEHRDQLSEGCRKEGQAKRAAFMKMRVACKGDAQKLCKDKRHPREVYVCLKEKHAELTGECKSIVETLPSPPPAKPGK